MNTLNTELEVETEEEIETNLDADGNPIGDVEETAEQIAAREKEEKNELEIHDDFNGLGDKAKVKAQKRFNKISGEKYRALDAESVANAKNIALENRLAVIESRLTGDADVAQPQEDVIAKPVREDDELDDDYIERLTDWKTGKAVTEAFAAKDLKDEKKKLQTEQINHSNTTIENFKAQSAIAMEKHDDYLEITNSVPIGLESPLGKEILESEEHGAEIMYQLGNDPELFNSIKTLTGKQLTKAIGNLEAALDKSKPEKPKQKKLPPDPANVNTRRTNHTGEAVDISKLSPDEYYRRSCGVKKQ